MFILFYPVLSLTCVSLHCLVFLLHLVFWIERFELPCSSKVLYTTRAFSCFHIKPQVALWKTIPWGFVVDEVNDPRDLNKYFLSEWQFKLHWVYRTGLLQPFLWYPAVLKHFVSSIWNFVMIGLEWEKEERWVVDWEWKRPKFLQDDLNGILSVKAKSVKNMEDKEPWVQALNGRAILPPRPMDEYFSTAWEPRFTAASCSHAYFSFLFISPTWENNGGGVFSSRCELNALLHTEVQEKGFK